MSENADAEDDVAGVDDDIAHVDYISPLHILNEVLFQVISVPRSLELFTFHFF